MRGLTIKRVKLTPIAAANIFRTAIDAGTVHGFGYWATLDGLTYAGALIASITLKERNHPSRRRKIDVHALEVGLAKGLSDGALDVGREFPDGPSSEIMLQYAMFGEQVYG